MGYNMIIHKTLLEGAAEIECSPNRDDRGWFTRYFCQEELYEINGGREIVQINSSFTKLAGTIRGLHRQKAPYEEDKIVRCIAGKIFDVMLDNRKSSATYGEWHSVILDAEKMNMVYVPKGFAHGFQTLTSDCQILYLHTQAHAPEAEAGYHYNSPELGINWPLQVTDLSERDKGLKDFIKKRVRDKR
jgi:dTDP-4-dehydrorhamnose 3,5-epimerase